MPYWAEIEIANTTDKARILTIPKGRMISPKDKKSNVQNLVTTSNTKVTIPPHGKAIVTVPTECTDPSFPSPSTTVMDVTTFGQQERRDDVFPGRSM